MYKFKLPEYHKSTMPKIRYNDSFINQTWEEVLGGWIFAILFWVVIIGVSIFIIWILGLIMGR
jgi:hypothetical protein